MDTKGTKRFHPKKVPFRHARAALHGLSRLCFFVTFDSFGVPSFRNQCVRIPVERENRSESASAAPTRRLRL